MQFEILNTIQYLVFIVLSLIMYHYTKKKFTQLQWKWYAIGLLVLTGITHKQFYTLTEVADVKTTSSIMLQQKDNFNTKDINSYLKNTKVVDTFQQSNEEYEQLLLEQQTKSKQLANEIDEKQ